MAEYDVLVIGSGVAGQTVATACADAGKRVAVADRSPFGGTCALRGCIPKKMLLAAAEAATRSEALHRDGMAGACRIDWPALMRRKRRYTDAVPERTVGWMRDRGITTLHGEARFVSPETVAVSGGPVRAEAVVIATGAKPADLGIEGQDAVLSSTDFLALDQMPAEVAFIGGGYVSFELARLAHLAGARVTIVHRSAHVLNGFDPFLTGLLAERYRAVGIDVRVNEPVTRIERVGNGRVRATTERGEFEVDAVFHGAGRVPDIDGLDLSTGGVASGAKGVTVDAHLRSVSNPRVWAAGDAAGTGEPLTPVAGAQGEVVAEGVLGKSASYDGTVTPSVVFSDPPLARVGVGADQATRDAELEIAEFDMSGWFTQTRVGGTAAGARVVTHRESGRIVGAHLLGVAAEEVVNVFALAIRLQANVAELRTMTWAYPTATYDLNYLTGRY